MRLFEPGPRVGFPARAVLADQSFVDFQWNVVQLLNKDFYFLFFGVNFVGGLYFLAVWAGRREDRSRLYFALSSIFMALYFFEMGGPVPLFPGTAYRGVMKGCLSWSVGFAVVFFLEYFPLHQSRWLKIAAAVVFGLAGLYVALGVEYSTVMARFTLALLPLQVAILFIVYLLIRAWRQGSADAETILIGTVIAVALGTYDVSYQIQGKVPVAWLQGIGFFAF